jgi:hypothetical protein
MVISVTFVPDFIAGSQWVIVPKKHVVFFFLDISRALMCYMGFNNIEFVMLHSYLFATNVCAKLLTSMEN